MKKSIFFIAILFGSLIPRIGFAEEEGTYCSWKSDVGGCDHYYYQGRASWTLDIQCNGEDKPRSYMGIGSLGDVLPKNIYCYVVTGRHFYWY